MSEREVADLPGPIATFPMYDFPELRPATDALWSAIAQRLRAASIPAPPNLTRSDDPASLWGDERLLLGQTCGLPLALRLADRVTLVATPCYAAPGCGGPFYRSALVVRGDERAADLAGFRGRICAINEPESNSGMNLLREAVLPFAEPGRGFFARALMTGSHEASLRAVASGEADIAAIDGVTWALLQRLRPAALASLRRLGWTPASPGLPLITARHTTAATLATLRQALLQVADDAGLASIRAELLLERFEILPLARYTALATQHRQAQEQTIRLTD